MTHPNGFDPTEEQSDAIAKIVDWYSSIGTVVRLFSDQNAPEFTFTGYAGTGKTRLIGPIIDRLGLDASSIRIATLSGKAAHVVRRKLIRDGRADLAETASTIHRLIYRPDRTALELLRAAEKRRADLIKLRETGALNDADTAELRRLDTDMPRLRREARKVEWVRRPPFELRDAGIRLLVIDEASMVNERMATHLMEFGIPILAIGDPAQLPPINGNAYFTANSPDAHLSEVHRQALDSAAIRVATDLRVGKTVYEMDGDSGRVAGWVESELLNFDQVLCGTNKKRWALIQSARSQMGLPTGIPVPGDKIIVLKNNHDLHVYNGQMFDVYHVEPDNGSGVVTAVVTEGSDDDLVVRRFGFDKRGFAGYEGEKMMMDEIKLERWKPGGGAKDTASDESPDPEGIVAATFGWAITTHKAQGSQFGSVLVMDEAWIFGKYAESSGRDPEAVVRSWRYTAATRAEDRVVLVGRP